MSKESIKKPRKAYAKPMIAVEDFTLNQFIASCAIKTRNKSKEAWMEELMVYSFFHYTVISNTNQFAEPVNCTNHADEDADTLCYHTSTSPLFTS
ncbi:MAG: hypothetical protein IJW14_02550 [Oscillospiraceae bacterium]|nr:hypothetical protein [Oscillospiraceae bacterium]